MGFVAQTNFVNSFFQFSKKGFSFVFKAGRMRSVSKDGKQKCVYTLWGARGKDCIMFALNKLAGVQECCSHGSCTGQLL